MSTPDSKMRTGDPGFETAEAYDPPMTTTARAPLTRERIIEAAADFADDHGLDELSMRKLAVEFDVGPMALYNHVSNKDDILDGMIDWVFTQIEVPEDRSNWKEATRVIGRSALDEFGRHPWVVVLLMQRGNFGTGALAFMDQVLGILRDAGFSDEDTQHAWQMLASHTMGYAFQQASSPGLQKEQAQIELMILQLGDKFPHVVALAPLLAECDFATEFRFGLEIILDGLERRLA